MAAIVLTDARSSTPVSLDYREATSASADGEGNLSEIRLKIPRGTELPPRVRAYVVTDVFPLRVEEL